MILPCVQWFLSAVHVTQQPIARHLMAMLAETKWQHCSNVAIRCLVFWVGGNFPYLDGKIFTCLLLFYHFELSVEQLVIRNVKICRLPVLPVEVQVTYRSSHFWWPTILHVSVFTQVYKLDVFKSAAWLYITKYCFFSLCIAHHISLNNKTNSVDE